MARRQGSYGSGTPRAVVSLFSGAGGLDIGLEAAGLSIAICVEADADARATLKGNRPHWRLAEPLDIFDISPRDLLLQAHLRKGEAALVAGGPPCQPFSKARYWCNRGAPGLRDPRATTLQAFLDVVEASLPRVVLLENVSGLALRNEEDRSGMDIIRQGLRSINDRNATRYAPQVIHINAADYGVPQHRERVFVVASIDGRDLEVPPPTHGNGNAEEPYLTAWDAIGDLDAAKWPAELEPRGKWARLLRSIPEGSNYLWHTARGGGRPLFGWRTKYWSFLLKLAKKQPSWTIQANPGPAAGPFHWRGRLLTITEIARLQTFPKGYKVVGDRASAHRQLGNAVPCVIGELLGVEIRRQLLHDRRAPASLRLVPPRRDGCPRQHPRRPVPQEYLHMEGNHPPHPGAGLGPGRRAR